MKFVHIVELENVKVAILCSNLDISCQVSSRIDDSLHTMLRNLLPIHQNAQGKVVLVDPGTPDDVKPEVKLRALL